MEICVCAFCLFVLSLERNAVDDIRMDSNEVCECSWFELVGVRWDGLTHSIYTGWGGGSFSTVSHTIFVRFVDFHLV